MFYGIEIGGVRLTQIDGQPVTWHTARAVKEAKLEFIAALVGSMSSAKQLPMVAVVEIPTVDTTNKPVVPLVDTVERTACMRRTDVPITHDPLASPRGWEEIEADEPDTAARVDEDTFVADAQAWIDANPLPLA